MKIFGFHIDVFDNMTMEDKMRRDVAEAEQRVVELSYTNALSNEKDSKWVAERTAQRLKKLEEAEEHAAMCRQILNNYLAAVDAFEARKHENVSHISQTVQTAKKTASKKTATA